VVQPTRGQAGAARGARARRPIARTRCWSDPVGHNASVLGSVAAEAHARGGRFEHRRCWKSSGCSEWGLPGRLQREDGAAGWAAPCRPTADDMRRTGLAPITAACRLFPESIANTRRACHRRSLSKPRSSPRRQSGSSVTVARNIC
jgi:hypothetical protein